MKILFLHGLSSVQGVKPTFLAQHDHTVLNPQLPDDDFDEAMRIALDEFDRHHPDVVVGSSRGGAVAMNIDSGLTPLVLLCPAWKRWGTITTVKPNTTVLHSEVDEVVPFADSQELLRNSGLPSNSLITVGTEHRLADEESLKRMLEVVEKTTNDTEASVQGKGVKKKRSGLSWAVIFITGIVLVDIIGVLMATWLPALQARFGHSIVPVAVQNRDGPPSKSPADGRDKPTRFATPARSHDKVIEELKRRHSGFFEGELDSAIATLSEAIRLNPKNAEAYHSRGVAYYKKADFYNQAGFDNAIADLSEAIRLNPKDAEAFYFRGMIYQQQAQAIKLTDAKAFYLNGPVFQRKKLLDKAIADLTEAVRLNPRDAESFWIRGTVYSQEDDLDRAIADYTEAIRLNPKDDSSYFCRGNAYGKKGKLDDAIADYTEAIRLKPKDHTIYWNRAIVYQKKGETARADEDRAKAKELGEPGM